jgi:hypothetical protein
MKSLFLSVIVALFLVTPGWAEEESTIGDMLKAYDRGNVDYRASWEQYIGNQGYGMTFANSALQNQGRALLYCVPNGKVQSYAQHFLLFRQIVEEMKYPLSKPTSHSGIYLIIALMEKFPCKK